MATKDPISAKKKKNSKKTTPPFSPSPDNTTGKTTAAYGEDNLTVGNFPHADRELYDLMCVWIKKNGHPPEVNDFPTPKNFHVASPTMHRFSHKSFSQRYLRHKNTIKTHNWIPPPYDIRLRPFVKCKANNWGVPSPSPQKEPDDAGDKKGPAGAGVAQSEEPRDKVEDVFDEDISIGSSSSSATSSSDDEDEDVSATSSSDDEDEDVEEQEIVSDEDADTNSEEEDGDFHCMSDF